MKRSLLGTLLALALAFSLAVPAFAAESAWQSAYTSVINQKASRWGNIIQLVDLDTDGTPELLIGGVPATGQLKLEGSTTLRTGAGYYANATFNYWRSGSTIGQTNTFTKDVSGNTTTYSVGGQKVSVNKYNSSYQNRHNGWSKVWSFRYAEATSFNKKISSAEIAKLFTDYGVDAPVLAVVSIHKVQVDGRPITISAYEIGGSNFFKLRDLGKALGFQVTWDSSTSTAGILTDQPYQE